MKKVENFERKKKVPIESRVRRVLLDGLSVECSSFEILS